jgi:uncharacterized protein (TIGR02677 family)
MTVPLRIWRSVDADLFRFTSTELRELHVAVMAAFEDAAVLAPALNFDQVRAALTSIGWDEPLPDELLRRALESLVDWRLLEASQDHAAHYATPEEFERRNLQWSLTRRGEAAVVGVLHALDSLAHAVGLQPAILDAIGDGLSELADLLVAPESADRDASVHLGLANVENLHAALVTSVRQFNGHLQRLMRDDATDDAVFHDVKRRTVAYLDEYVDGVERPVRRLAAAVDRLDRLGVESLFDRALIGANLAPVAGGDPAPGWLAERERRWRALRAWFAPPDASPARVAGLLDTARTAIIQLLRVLERRWDSRRRAASVANDFRRLASWFDDAPGDDEAHRLFGAAFGLWPARHAHVLPVDGEARAPNESWAAAAAVAVAPTLRTSGSTTNRGRSAGVADPAKVRALRQRAQAEALATLEAVQGSLSTGGSVRLSTFGQLPLDAFAELVALIALGLDAPRSGDGTRRALSSDGRVEIVLSDPVDGRVAAISTAAGVLRGPDLWVSITLVADRQPHLPAGVGEPDLKAVNG